MSQERPASSPTASSATVEDAEDHEIFDINDFTTASDWERFFSLLFLIDHINNCFLYESLSNSIRFIVQIEELINEWKLNSSNNDNIGESSNLQEVTV